ncbi:MAG: hypothetical protein ACM3UV_06600 [Nocardioidaceae bacterium]
MTEPRRSAKPLLLLDIDGTLCPIGPGPGGPMTRLATGGVGSVSFRADLPELLAELGRRFELAWATAWEDSANLLLAPALRLPALPVVRFSDPAPGEVGDRFAGRTWKLPSVRRFAGRRAVAWVDDDLHPDAYAWAALRASPTKLITTEPSAGLTDAELRALLAFAST